MSNSSPFVPELLSPAGTLKHLEYAIAYGADAVYAGQPRYSLRVRNNSFKNAEALAEGIQAAQSRGKKFYLTSNVSPHNDKVRSYLRDLEPIVEAGPDAIIMADPGLIMMVRERWPDLEVHLSVQANAVNYATVKFWHNMGLKRVILSRELGLEEVRAIREKVPEMEIEVFVHGALCMAYSGRCLLSGYMNHRDANQGACTNACRWNYKPLESRVDDTGDVVSTSRVEIPVTQELVPPEPRTILLKEPNDPRGTIAMHEDEHGTYIMNSRDLRAVQHVKALTEMGVHSLKIEGRTKSVYYAARTAQVYRRAIDDAVAGREFDMGLMDELEAMSNRGYTEGFFRRHRPEEYQTYEQGTSKLGSQQLVGEVLEADDRWIYLDVKNRFELNDEVLLMTPKGNRRFTLEVMESDKGEKVTEAPGSGYRVRIPRFEGLDDAALGYGMLARYM
ncbi:MAG TPA: tRNA 5-hydroxyuridine modification protein YegQ [Alcanivoracaceae bacterium]|nr:tRNA 5-hydroxyuridine modification protein YegQ [Alcanivoracaceae bacterium]